MRIPHVAAAILLSFLCGSLDARAGEVKLVRYPHLHGSQIAFTYLGDVWTADDTGGSIRRLTVHAARDANPRFSPDGKWIAFSSARHGNLDVFVIPAQGGTARQLTFHSVDDLVQGWSPDSTGILFASSRGEDFAGKLYTVRLDGGMPRPAGPDFGVHGTYSPDGRKLAVNRKSQAYWRKHYRGAAQSDVTVMDLATKTFKDLTDHNGLDSWPMWARDGHIYFVSDREGGGLSNIWRVPEAGGAAERVTTFSTGDVRWPAMSTDGKTIVFEHEFGIWRLDLASRRATPIRLDIAAETQVNMTEVRDFSSEADDYDLAPSTRRLALSVHGEIFTVPHDEGDVVQITESSARDKEPQYSPDGKWIAFVSDRSGREELYVVSADGAGAQRRITDLDLLKLNFAWSPDSRTIAFSASDNTLRAVTLEDGRGRELAKSAHGNIGPPAWSPDSKWIAYAKPDHTRASDVYLVAAAGGEERKVTFDPYTENTPRFSPDGRKLYYLLVEGFGFGAQAPANVHAVTLERETRDPDEPREESEEPPAGRERATESSPRAATPAPPVNIDWAGLKRRARQITRMPYSVTTYAVAPDSRSIVFAVNEPSASRTAPVIYTIQADGRRLTRLAAGQSAADADNGPGGGPQGGGISTLRFTSNGRTLFFLQRDAIYSVAVPQTADRPSTGGGGRGAAAAAAESTPRRVNFSVKVRIDRAAEWAEMFDDAWRTMKYRFYDPKMHGKDWDAMRAKYQPLVAHVGDRQELLNIVNEMIGELNASHTGAAPPSERGGVSTGHLGVELQPDDAAGRYKVTHVFEGGPADKDWVHVSVGDHLIAIQGTPIKAGDNYWPLLNHRLNRTVEVTFNNTPAPEGGWKTRIAPVTTAAFSQLRYERWVKQRREMVDTMSSGRIGYLHIQAMNQPSLRKFEKELRENRTKDALVIDERWNGGGNIDQELLGILVQRQYQVWQPRGTEPAPRPFSGFFGPKVVLQNWRSGSNAEMFPAGFRALGLGKVIGTPTAGAVIGTGSYRLIDGSTVRTPATGVFLADPKRTNMENYGVQPDILVENSPEDNLAGRDRQLETAVQELLKELTSKPVTAQR